jgi:hypothetical protein
MIHGLHYVGGSTSSKGTARRVKMRAAMLPLHYHYRMRLGRDPRRRPRKNNDSNVGIDNLTSIGVSEARSFVRRGTQAIDFASEGR